MISRLKPGSVVLMHDGNGNGRQAAKITDLVLTYAAKHHWVVAPLCPTVATLRTKG